jgi:hypothetical protein
MKVLFFTLDHKHLGDVSLLVNLICTSLVILLTVAISGQKGFLAPYLVPRNEWDFLSLSWWLLILSTWLGLCSVFQKDQNKWYPLVSLFLCLLCFAFSLLLCVLSI